MFDSQNFEGKYKKINKYEKYILKVDKLFLFVTSNSFYLF